MSPKTTARARKTDIDLENTDALEPGSGETGAKIPSSPDKVKARLKDVNKVLEAVFKQYPRDEASLIMILQEVQDKLNWLPPEALDRVADELDLPRARVLGVATFYKAFSLEPRGKKLIKVCMGTACHVRGAGMLVDELERKLEIKAGKGVSKDGAFSLETVNCVGACAMAPAVVVGDNYYANVSPGNLSGMLKKEQPK